MIFTSTTIVSTLPFWFLKGALEFLVFFSSLAKILNMKKITHANQGSNSHPSTHQVYAQPTSYHMIHVNSHIHTNLSHASAFTIHWQNKTKLNKYTNSIHMTRTQNLSTQLSTLNHLS